MTLSEARRALSGRLEFGNPEQIKANQFLEKVGTLVELVNSGQASIEPEGIVYWSAHDRFSDDVEDAAREQVQRKAFGG